MLHFKTLLIFIINLLLGVLIDNVSQSNGYDATIPAPKINASIRQPILYLFFNSLPSLFCFSTFYSNLILRLWVGPV